MTHETGGFAFPQSMTAEGPFGGMTLLDYAAIKALQGMLAHPTRYKPRQGASSNWHEAISEEAYEIGRAMITERNKQK